MASVEIANAYVALTAKFPNVKKDIAEALGAPIAPEVEKSGSSLGGKLMKGVKGGALAAAAVAGTAIAVTLGTALTKGFQRLNAIDQATAKMEGLGFTSDETAGLMDNALASVRGTAFGLGDAATVAAQLAASGLGPGQEMADVLTTVANTAAAAGTGLSDIGSIFAKVQSTGKAQNDVLQQLADRGIPIYQKLAEQLGVSTDEVFSLASAGKIGFAEFEAAAQSASGGVAAAMGGTVQGSFDNLVASLGRIGAGLLGGVFDQIAPMLQNITAGLAPLEEKASQFGETIGEIIKVVSVGFTGNLMEEDSFLPLSMVQNAMQFGEVLRTIFDTVGPLIGQIAELGMQFSPVLLAFQVLGPILPQIVSMIGQVASVIGGALGQVLQAIMPVLVQVADVFAQLVAQIIPPLLPIIEQLAGIISQVLLAVLPLIAPLMQLIEAIFPILQAVIAALIPVIQGVVDAIASVLIPVVDTLVAILGGVIDFLTGVFTGNWEKAWQGIQDIFGGIFEGIVAIGKGVINGIIDLINGFLGGLNEVGNFVADATGGAIDFSIGKIPHLAEGGVVSRRQGGTLAVVGEGRYDEAVVPLSPGVLSQLGGGGGQTWNQYNTFEHEDPAVGVELAGQKFAAIAQRARA
ncbi:MULTISPECIES: tape measure protein [unclassified Microbacterium]|uniref:phage tail protein n=1 Tax=unclassified Microbacterium TaxID=2609290 RepID=UPI0010F89AB4|nr:MULTISPECIES: tape measure protein [unclassified Microbacterium]